MKEKEQSYINKDDAFSLNCYNVIAPIIEVVKTPPKTPRTDKRKAYDKVYYEANKERLKQLRRERFEKDKSDPERYSKILLGCRNAQKRYTAKVKTG